MNSFEDVLGHMLARIEDVNIKKVVGAYDPDKQKHQNVNHLASSKFLLKDNIDPTISFLVEHTKEFYPHATPIIDGTITSGKTKVEKAADIINVLCSISPVQCRKCTKPYISTSPENTEATLKCLLCGRKSHADCYKDYTVDNTVGIVFLCDPCLTTSETTMMLENLNSKQEKPDQKAEERPNHHDGVTEIVGNTENTQHTATNDGICPMYKENSCPHGLTGKRHIEGLPCSYKHPPKCFYHIGKYGSGGCRYSEKRCPYFHPTLCENSVKLQMCLNKECKRYHLAGTRRSIREHQQQPNADSQQRLHDVNRRQTTNSVWDSRHNEDNRHQNTGLPRESRRKQDNYNQAEANMCENRCSNSPQQETNTNNERGHFLEYIQQVNSSMMQMKLDMEKSVRDIIRDTLAQKSAGEQTVLQTCNLPTIPMSQYIQPQNDSTITPNPAQPHNLQTYQPIPIPGLYTLPRPM